MTKHAEHTPEVFVDAMADWMVEHGPDGHCDGHEQIAALAWSWMQEHSAAPELLEALEEMVHALENGHEIGNMGPAYAAIAKARGQQHAAEPR